MKLRSCSTYLGAGCGEGEEEGQDPATGGERSGLICGRSSSHTKNIQGQAVLWNAH